MPYHKIDHTLLWPHGEITVRTSLVIACQRARRMYAVLLLGAPACHQVIEIFLDGKLKPFINLTPLTESLLTR